MAVKVDLDKCNGCGQCFEVCSIGGIKIENGKAVVNEQCVDCESCLSVCPNEALTSGLAYDERKAK
ncbi:MAG: 4Fe-4S binding protein [Candidatus Omnitrophica bacterium]|nr:4Fe-4S binding protein [Candidatus Omnitrophota bacterium]MDD5670336.1 4Fe-4S binding protein [Candidatus Omnitrophota bacterium]